jgi:16S rRNA (guanine(966)-N(2))-methyltransferase RsmD
LELARVGFTTRIIAGTLKNRTFKTPEGKQTRPALALIRRIIFDTLQPCVVDSEILDLFAGSGAFVFEGISRGAKKATAIDVEPKVISLLKSNSEMLGISDLIETYSVDALRAIPELGRSGRKFDLIFIAPPYFKELTQESLKLLDDNPIIRENGIVVAQLHRKEEIKISLSRLALFKTKRHGITIIQFYKCAKK